MHAAHTPTTREQRGEEKTPRSAKVADDMSKQQQKHNMRVINAVTTQT